ncbi:gluconate 5-dehydrogenase [Microbotryum lychnidis-dioicae p1A1 Lamole]|uniref:Gluconate 5-dehydrogenase n=1 Tax=Microbotryum lychnidis-dioicae (strain p1A1 Lamole / MvSl-1064) TaxID=683840 RepID=U5H7K8_USTV1|nr:gluconate 5-dehydrogenase [Microbotryum lychnidis-dioicae p1A1 Lamole]|eukprot:KDE06449.1 gluconate 5-dehydrogenase [Microbotryum lychnidis-dioicae p1A1 Lamole]
MFARQALRTAVRARAPYRFAPLVVPSASFSSAASLSKSFVTRRGAKRGISSTPALEGAQEPTHAAVDPEIVHEYPEEHEFVEGDLGHSTDGPEVDVGKHNQRTLASFSMTNKVCVITGAARGLGNLFARTFAESGSNAIVILDLDQGLAETAAKDLVDWFEEHGQAEKGEISAIGLGCDVADEKNVQDCFAKVVEKYGRIDVLVTAAGIVENFPAQDYPTEKFRKLMAINVDGSFFCAREAAKDMMRRDAPGSIVMIGSMSGACVNVPQPQAPYNASKAAVRHMASSLAVEWATRNIRVNAISPGYMATALTRVILDRDPVLKETWENLTPMGRIGEPEDLKGAVIYLASDASGFTTGTDLRVDGGYTLT